MPAADRFLPKAWLLWDGPGAAYDARGSTKPRRRHGVKERFPVAAQRGGRLALSGQAPAATAVAD